MLPPHFIITFFLVCPPFDDHWAASFEVAEREIVDPGLAYGWHSLNACKLISKGQVIIRVALGWG